MATEKQYQKDPTDAEIAEAKKVNALCNAVLSMASALDEAERITFFQKLAKLAGDTREDIAPAATHSAVTLDAESIRKLRVITDPETGAPVKVVLPSGKELPAEYTNIGGGKTREELEAELDQKSGVNVGNYTRHNLLRNSQFTTLENPESISTVRLTVADLGFPGGATTRKILGTFDKNGKSNRNGKIHELGLELCPDEFGPEYLLQHGDQVPTDKWLRIGMEPLTGSGGRPDVFRLRRIGDGLWLSDDWASPDDEWDPGNAFVFRLPAGAACPRKF
jgi:hypothetical protein